MAGTYTNAGIGTVNPDPADQWTAVESMSGGGNIEGGIWNYDTLIIRGPSWQTFIRINGDSTYTNVWDIEQAASGDVYFVGEVLDSIIFNPSKKYRYANEGLLLVKLNSSGVYQWHKYLPLAEGYDLELDPSDNPVVVGRRASDALLMNKYNPSGTLIAQLSATSGGSGFGEGHGIALSGSHFYVTGTFLDSLKMGNKVVYSSSQAMFMAKVKADLSGVEWLDESYFPGSACIGYDVEIDGCGYPVGAGTYRSGRFTGKLWLYRYHPDGTYLGSYTFNGGAEHVEAYAMEITGTNTFNIGGQFHDTMVGPLNSINPIDTNLLGFTATIDTCMLSAMVQAESYSTSWSSAPINLSGFPSGGTFSGVGVTGTQFDPNVAGPGDHVIYYSVSDCHCSALDSITIHVDCYPNDQFIEYMNIHQHNTQNYPHFRRKESDYFVDSIPDRETGLPTPVQRVITVATSQDNSGDIYVSLAADSGRVIWTNRYGGSNQDRGTSVKKCADGYIVSGTTLSYGSTKKKPFLLRLNRDGSVKWFQVYEISNHVLSTNAVELNNGDIAMVGFYNGHEYSGQVHDFFTLVADSTGSLLAFRQLGKATRNWEYMRDVEPTSDGGFVIVGNTGHNYDYHAGLVIKMDNSYNVQWAHKFRRTLAGGVYNLNGPSSERSNTFFTAIKETASGEFIVVGRTSDHTGSGTNATFRHGLIVRLSSTGNLINHLMVAKDVSEMMLLHNLTINDRGETVVTGKTRLSSSGLERTHLFALDPLWSSLVFSVEYDMDAKNVGLGVWQSPDRGYTITGLTGATGSTRKPFVINSDSVGTSQTQTLCDVPLTIHMYQDPIEESIYNWEENNPDVSESGYSIGKTDLCVQLFDCSATGVPTGREKVSADDDEWLDVVYGSGDELQKDPIQVYPNPATNQVSFTRPVLDVKILDLSGRIILDAPGLQANQLSLGELTPGTYLISWKENEGSLFETTPLIIE
ncbi:T9SS type A sorting domain-containing protein [bacterium SCSIO 12741]|nr:T9SS type A sorting domain-containing protein [bacterium SCSIO 12741]